MVMVAALAMLVVLTSGTPATAQTARPVVAGTVLSHLDPDVRRLSVRASDDAGRVRFVHRGVAGVSRFTGDVTCAVHDGDVVRLTGRVVTGKTAAGVVLSGKDFGFTLGVGAAPQTFSLPRFGAPGTLVACSGGQATQVPVTAGHLRVEA